MRTKAAIISGAAAVALGGGLVLALNGGGTASAAGSPAAPVRAAAVSPSVATISRSQAEALALRTVGGGQIRSAELETEHGVTVWSVKVIKSGVTYDVNIDARTGKVVRNRQETGRPRGRDDDGAAHPDRTREPGHRAAEPEARHDRAHEAEHRHDRAGEAEHRHGGDDAVEDHHHRGGDDHGGDDGHRGRGH
jgi:hypothetical protein